jgi:hypothetical protein
VARGVRLEEGRGLRIEIERRLLKGAEAIARIEA